MTRALCLDQEDGRFPRALLLAPDPPARVWLRGDLSLLGRPAVGIIGSREPTGYGLGVTFDAARDLASSGLVIVSGMARGLDARAHQGALAAGGGTIAVLGCGIDVDYPKQNLGLLNDVRERGLVLTEFEPGIEPTKWTFPKRNRLIAALSSALIVAEAKLKSGTANTVEWMLRIGRPVFAIPGRIGDPLSAGPNAMIRDGAHIYLHANDVRRMFELPLEPEEGRPEPAKREHPDLPRAEADVFDLLGRRPVHVDDLALRCRMEPGLLLAALSSLELRGLVEQLPGKRFALAS